jgi:hypothetical protein
LNNKNSHDSDYITFLPLKSIITNLKKCQKIISILVG